ncbi:atrial natriuretic peptide receptor 1-like [Paramacrobiotus metropolitanus]|uniref:atrial natriuretic peptide receptor 1-like n=1 Tax=Paramacrobiotus metropolitanus TaxID=2943436 RepID=UPI0024458899|nr:atrial natriuretic peptide receptor 1-like [Paramacrobiotus metropolitanus]
MLLTGFCLIISLRLAAATTTLKAGIILTQGSKNLYDYDVVKAALRAGYDDSLSRFDVRFEERLCLYKGDCSVTNAVGQTYICGVTYAVDVIIGPGCTDDMMASLEPQTWLHIPSVTGGGTLVDSTAKFPYITRVSYNTYTQWVFFINMCKKFLWTNVAIIFNRDNNVNKINEQSLVKNLNANNITPIELPLEDGTIKIPAQAEQYLQNASLSARVVVILTDGTVLRKFMLAASNLGFTNGDYAFFSLDPFRDDILGKNGWQLEDNFDNQAKQAYEALMVLTLRDTSRTERYKLFAQTLNETAARDFPGMAVTLNYYVASFYDSILVYAASVNRTLMNGQSIDLRVNIDGLSQAQWNRSLPGATGDVYINPLGDRNDDHSMYGFDDKGNPYIIADFFGYKIIQNPAYTFDQVAQFHWLSAAKTPPINEPFCGYLGDKPICDNSKQTLGIALGAVAGVLVIGTALGIFLYRYYTRKAELAQMDLLGTWADIQKPQIFLPRNHGKDKEHQHGSGGSHISLQMKSMFNDMSKFQTRTVMALFKEHRVIVRVCEVSHVDMSSSVLKEVKTVRAINNENVLALHGLCPGPGRAVVMYNYCSKGSVSDLLESSDVKLDWIFKFSFIKNILSGLSVISNVLGCHGRLTSKCCFVDAHFIARVADYGLPSFFARTVPLTQDSAFCATLLWTAPELLSRPFAGGTQEGDVYSYAIILSEIIMRETAYSSTGMEPDQIVAKVAQKAYKPFRPKFDANECPPEISVLLKQCWASNPLERPRIAQIKSAVKESEKSNAEQGSILDTLIRRMENYTLDLQATVEEKAAQFQLEKEKSEQLLYQILPRVVVDQLKRGEQVKPEDYDNVTIFQSDIVGFTTISSMSSPTEVVDLLNDLYTAFDGAIMKFDAYKVETIGDCYVVASGIPARNGNKHAVEICRLAIMLLEQIKVFKMKHRPQDQLRLRLGAHTGAVVSGVVGLVMPRYCLFGETMTIASKMESTSQPMRIQISQACERLLQTIGQFDTEARDDPVKIKEGLEIQTYWLQREIM